MVNSNTLSPAYINQILLDAGFNSTEAIIMQTIGQFECGGCEMSKPVANYDKNGNITSYDIGLFQINSGHWQSSDPTHSVYGDLTDPVVSAKAAFSVFMGGGGRTNVGGVEKGFLQWCTYPGGCNGASKITNAEFGSMMASVVQSIQAGGGSVPPSPSNPPDIGGAIGGIVGGIGNAIGGAAGGIGNAISGAVGGGSSPNLSGADLLKSIPGPFGIPLAGGLVVTAGILFIFIGLLMWGNTGDTKVQIASTAAKAVGEGVAMIP